MECCCPLQHLKALPDDFSLHGAGPGEEKRERPVRFPNSKHRTRNAKHSYFRTNRTSTAATPPPCARTMIGLISMSVR